MTLGSVVAAAPASAYTLSGCKWNKKSFTVNSAGTNGTMRTALSDAATVYDLSTDVTMVTSSTASSTLTAANNNYGQTGWEGIASPTCSSGVTSKVHIRANDYYLPNLSSQRARIKVVWLHELGHALGLGHVSTLHRVMYTSASSAYYDGVYTLTGDELNGINALY